MTLPDFLLKLNGVKPTHGHWKARCPAHDDREPSLSVAQGDEDRILLHCFAGCDPQAICASLGLTLTDLFPEDDCSSRRGSLAALPPRRLNYRDLAFQFELHALDCERQAEAILTEAKGVDCAAWTDADWDAAQSVSRAYELQVRAAVCQDYADHCRERWYESH